MSKLIVFMSMSLDGYIAATDDGPGRGLGLGGEPLHAWMTDSFQPTDSANAAILSELMSTGAAIAGRHTFEWAGEWGGDHHDGIPMFVLTRTPPEQPVRGLAHYLTDPATAVAQAKAAAGDKNVMMHGASTVQALHRLGLIDEYVISLVPIVLGHGKRLFAAEPETDRLELTSAIQGEGVLHLRYQVKHTTEPERTER